VKRRRHAAFVAASQLALLGALMLGARAATAASDCAVTASGVAFGTYDPSIATPDDSTGSVVVTCTYTGPGGSDTANYTVTLSTGTSSSYAPRKLAAGASRLNYNLFRDAAYAAGPDHAQPRFQVIGAVAGAARIATWCASPR